VKSLLNHASVVISLTLAGMYALGLMYHLSYLKAFGIEETQFPFSIDRVFFQGFLAFANLTAPNIGFVIMCAAGVLITSWGALIVFETTKRLDMFKSLFSSIQKLFVSEPQQIQLNQALEGFANFSMKVFSYVVAGVLFYLSVLIVLVAAEHTGKEGAQRYMEKINAHGVPMDTLQVINAKGEIQEYKGYSIICNVHQCAYFDGKKSTVFNHTAVKSLHSEPL